MKIIDRDGRLFGKISVVDVLVVAVVVAMAAALYVKTNHKEITSTASGNIPITYQFWVRGVRTYVADAIQVGDMAYDHDYSSGGPLGVITEIEVSPGTKMAEMRDGTIRSLPAGDCVDLLLTIQGEGIVSEGRYLLNRVYDLGVNSARNYDTKYAQFTGLVTAIF